MQRNSRTCVLTLALLWLLPLATCEPPAAETFGPAYDVADFGANGSDNEDDTAAFVAALEAAAETHAQVNVPPGVYVISEPLTVGEGVSLVGAGMGRTRLTVAEGTEIENFICPASGAAITDLEIDGGGRIDTTIHATGASNLLIQRCRIHHVTVGIHVNRSDGQILDNVIHDCARPAIEFGHNAAFLEISGNRIFDCKQGIQGWGLASTKHQDIRTTEGFPDDPGASSRIVIANNRVSRSASSGIWAAGLKEAVIIGNVVEDCTDYGIDLEWCYKVSIIGNFVRGCSPAGIALFIRATQCTVTGNTVNMRGMPRGIWLNAYAHHNTVSGNSVTGLPVGAQPNQDREKQQKNWVRFVDAGIGIDVTKSTNNTITGNLIDGVAVGIHLSATEQNVITGNHVNALREALYLYRARRNLVTSNFLGITQVEGEQSRVIVLDVNDPNYLWGIGNEAYPSANNIIRDNILAGGELTIFEAPGTVGPAGNQFTDNILIDASHTPFQLDPVAAAVERNNQRLGDVEAKPELSLEGLLR